MYSTATFVAIATVFAVELSSEYWTIPDITALFV